MPSKVLRVKVAPPRVRTTLVIESLPRDFEKALQTAVAFARGRYMFITIGSKKVDGPRIHCRTTVMRRKKAREESST